MSPQRGGEAIDEALLAIAERVLNQKVSTAYGLSSAACPNPEQQEGIDDLWMRIGGSWGSTYYWARCIAEAYAEGMAVVSPQRGGWWPEQCLFTVLGVLVVIIGGIVMAIWSAGAW